MATTVNQEVFYDFISRKSYEIPKNLQSKFPLYKNRYTLAIASGILIWSFNDNAMLSMIISTLFIVVSEIMLRTSFLVKCKEVPNKKPMKQEPSNGIRIILIFLWSLVSVINFILFISFESESNQKWLILCAAVLALIAALLQSIQLIRNKK